MLEPERELAVRIRLGFRAPLRQPIGSEPVPRLRLGCETHSSPRERFAVAEDDATQLVIGLEAQHTAMPGHDRELAHAAVPTLSRNDEERAAMRRLEAKHAALVDVDRLFGHAAIPERRPGQAG